MKSLKKKHQKQLLQKRDSDEGLSLTGGDNPGRGSLSGGDPAGRNSPMVARGPSSNGPSTNMYLDRCGEQSVSAVQENVSTRYR